MTPDEIAAWSPAQAFRVDGPPVEPEAMAAALDWYCKNELAAHAIRESASAALRQIEMVRDLDAAVEKMKKQRGKR